MFSLTKFKKRLIFFSFLFFFIITCGKDINLQKLLPDEVSGFKKSFEPLVFNKKNLFDYIDGGAEIYLSYDFLKLLVQKYSDSKKEITVELYKMSSSYDAYGLYSLDQNGEKIDLGQNGVYGDGLLRFWKGNYFVKILDISGEDEQKDVILRLGKKISDRIKNEGEKPSILSLVPENGLVSGTFRFFHKNIVLKNLYFLKSENILNLSEKTDALLLDYKFDDQIVKLLLIEYFDSLSAENAYKIFNRDYLKKNIKEYKNIVQIEKEKFLGIELNGKYLFLIFEAKEKKFAEGLLDKVKERIKGKNLN